MFLCWWTQRFLTNCNWLIQLAGGPNPIFKIPQDINWADFRAVLSNRKKAFNAANLDNKEIAPFIEQTVKSRDGYEIPIRLYQPAEPRLGGAPLVLLFHGGGFCLGDLDGEELVAQRIRNKHGCVVVNVDYRLAPEHPFPAAINDAWDVLIWAAAEAKNLGADPTAGFLVGGTSAGGNLSAVLQVKAKNDQLSPPLTGAFLLIPAVTSQHFPPKKYASELLSLEQNKDAPVLDRHNIDVFMGGYKPDPNSDLFNVLALDDDKLKGLTPTFFQICGADPLRDEALIYDRELRRLGVTTQVKMYPGLPHGFWSIFPTWGKSQSFVDDTIQGVAWLLEQKK
jgi:acetyl esterase/lipase